MNIDEAFKHECNITNGLGKIPVKEDPIDTRQPRPLPIGHTLTHWQRCGLASVRGRYQPAELLSGRGRFRRVRVRQASLPGERQRVGEGG